MLVNNDKIHWVNSIVWQFIVFRCFPGGSRCNPLANEIFARKTKLEFSTTKISSFQKLPSKLANYLPWWNIERNEVWTVSQQLVAVVVKCVVNQFLNIFSESILNEATTVCQWPLSHQCVTTVSEIPRFFSAAKHNC